MKAKEGDRVRTVVDVNSPFNNRTVTAGATGVIVDAPTDGKVEAYAVDLGQDGDYDHVVLTPDKFEVVE